jgi:REP element-mobilizing transposase RayT
MVRKKCCTFAIVMANTYTQLYTHIVFHVKSTGIIMRDEDLERVFQYIGGIIRDEGAIPFAVGGVADHIHILTTLPKNMSLADFMRVIKANSSKWLRRLDSYYESFRWQDGYGAFSVSPSLMERTTKYIFGQAEHHKTKTYHDEYCETLKAYGIEYDERYAFGD